MTHQQMDQLDNIRIYRLMMIYLFPWTYYQFDILLELFGIHNLVQHHMQPNPSMLWYILGKYLVHSFDYYILTVIIWKCIKHKTCLFEHKFDITLVREISAGFVFVIVVFVGNFICAHIWSYLIVSSKGHSNRNCNHS